MRTAGRLSRRDFALGAIASLAATQTTSGCTGANIAPDRRRGHVDAQPSATRTRLTPGTHPLGLRQHRDGVLQLPATPADGPLPLLVLLHGAGGSGSGLLRLLSGDAAIVSRAAILAPDAEGRSWDALTPESQTFLDFLPIPRSRRLSGFGPDIAFLDQALAHVFRNVAIDPARIAIGGFSDGATYALSLGLINGELFRRIVAFSPGFILNGDRRGRPDVFISHGRHDAILPINRTTRRIAPLLKQNGHSLVIREFDGGHEVPKNIAREALEWAVR
jgi:phospholipase/carboxylesterase